MLINIVRLIFWGYLTGALIFLAMSMAMSFRVQRREGLSLLGDVASRTFACAWMSFFWPIILKDVLASIFNFRRAK